MEDKKGSTLPEDIADFVMDREDEKAKAMLYPVSELRRWLTVLMDPHPVADFEVLNFLDVLDPEETGFFRFDTLLTMTAGEFCVKHEKSPKKVSEPEINNNSISDGKEADGTRYTLRPRKSLRKPRRMIREI